MSKTTHTERILAILRDGRHLIGILRSFDQYSNLVLEQTVERRYVGKQFTDIPLGLFILRGENVVMIGQCNPMKEAQLLQSLPIEEFQAIDDVSRAMKSEKDLWNFDKPSSS